MVINTRMLVYFCIFVKNVASDEKIKSRRAKQSYSLRVREH